MSSTTRDIEQRSERKELPEGWRWIRLGEVCELNPRRPFIDRHDSELTSFIPMESVDAVLGVVSSIRERPYGEVKNGYTFFAEADVLFAKITPCMQNGKHAIAVGIIDGIGFGTTEFHVIRPSESIISEFIWFFVRQPIVLADAIKHFTGAIGQQRVPEGYLAELEIPLPPLSEQQRIAAILKEQMGAVEKARMAAQERLRAIKALPAAFLRQIFPDPGQPLPEGWRWAKLGEVCEVIGGSTPDTGNSAYWNGDIAWVTPTDLGKFTDITILATSRQITLSGLQNCGTQMLPVGTVIMSSRAPIGHLAIAGVSLCTNQGCKSFVPGMGVDSVFLYWAIKRAVPDIQALGSGATFAEVSKSILYQFEIPLPTLPEQQRIAAILREQLAAIEQARIAAEAELKAINTLPAALLRRAFNGEL